MPCSRQRRVTVETTSRRPTGSSMAVGSSSTTQLRPHGQHAGYGHALLLAAGEQVRRVQAVLVHAHGLERLVHAAAYLAALHAQVLRREGDVVLHDVGDYLVVRVLEDQADRAAHVQEPVLVRRCLCRPPSTLARLWAGVWR